jgi:hypothetical protein
MKNFITFLLWLFSILNAQARQKKDTTVFIGQKTITLSEVVLNNKLNIPVFIERIKNDTSFYKAFRNLHVIDFTAINDIRMNNSNGEAKATLHSKTTQIHSGGCRTMKTIEEVVTGNFYDDNRNYNYYTAQMYASLFFTKDTICGEDNIVLGREFNTAGKSGMEKHKEQLKKLFFNPGKKINGLPFISNKTAIFDDDLADKYDMSIDFDIYNNTNCYVFRQTVKPGSKDGVVIDEMATWFDEKTYEVMARNYSLSYSAGVYDFKVQMEVVLTKFGTYLVPSLLRYTGNWKAIFKPRERGVFTATLFDFK